MKIRIYSSSDNVTVEDIRTKMQQLDAELKKLQKQYSYTATWSDWSGSQKEIKQPVVYKNNLKYGYNYKYVFNGFSTQRNVSADFRDAIQALIDRYGLGQYVSIAYYSEGNESNKMQVVFKDPSAIPQDRKRGPMTELQKLQRQKSRWENVIRDANLDRRRELKDYKTEYLNSTLAEELSDVIAHDGAYIYLSSDELYVGLATDEVTYEEAIDIRDRILNWPPVIDIMSHPSCTITSDFNRDDCRFARYNFRLKFSEDALEYPVDEITAINHKWDNRIATAESKLVEIEAQLSHE